MDKRLAYQEQIKEEASDLLKLERRQRLTVYVRRLRYIRALKLGNALTQKQASELVGISERQGQRIWSLYKALGLSGLLAPINRPGAPPKLDASQQSDLDAHLKTDQIQFLHEAVDYVSQEHDKEYSISGMHYLFKRMKVKKKTGRPSNIRQDKQGLEAFKKTINHS